MLKQNLLQEHDKSEYPTEFLVARLLGKKGRLFRNWEPLIASPNVVESLQQSPFYPYLKKYAAAGMQRFLRNEHVWVYRRMNDRLRKNFRTYFGYHAINTLITCLRYLSAGKDCELVLQELHNSLLHDEIRKILTSDRNFPAILTGLEPILIGYSDLFEGLRKRYETNGIDGLEHFIRDGFYGTVFLQKPPEPLRIFFQFLVDMQNCMSLAKTLRWQLDKEPETITGGSIPVSLFNKAFLRKDLAPVLRQLRLQDPESFAAAPAKLEGSLLRMLTGKLQKLSRQRTATADILFCLWEQYRYTRNISMIFHTEMAADELVRERLVA